MPQTCHKDDLLFIEGAGIDWNTMIWDAVNFVPGFDGAASGAVVGDHGNGTITGSNPGPGVPARLELHGQLPLYTGPLVNCKITLSGMVYINAASFGLYVLQDGAQLLITPTSQPANGDYLFTVAAGTNSLIEVGGSLTGVPPFGVGYAAIALAAVSQTGFIFKLDNV